MTTLSEFNLHGDKQQLEDLILIRAMSLNPPAMPIRGLASDCIDCIRKKLKGTSMDTNLPGNKEGEPIGGYFDWDYQDDGKVKLYWCVRFFKRSRDANFSVCLLKYGE